jgi:putative transposase
MARKRHTAEEIVAKLRQVDMLMAQGGLVVDAVRAIGVTEVTCYRWWNQYGRLKGDQVKRLKELEPENSRLRRAVSDLTLDSSFCQRPQRETSEPVPTPRMRGSCQSRARRLRETGVPRLGQHRST